MDELKEIKHDISSLYKKTGNNTERIVKLETFLPFLEDILERNTKSDEKLSETLTEVQTTMLHMNEKIESQSIEVEHMRNDLEQISSHNETNMESINKRISLIEEKSSYDILSMIKKYFPWLVVLIGLGVASLSSVVTF